jgi:hypothetical protein
VEKNKKAFERRALKSIASHIAGRPKKGHLKMLLLKEEGRRCVDARRIHSQIWHANTYNWQLVHISYVGSIPIPIGIQVTFSASF